MGERVSANTEHLMAFVSHGETYLDSLVNTEEQNETARQNALDMMGDGPLSSARTLQELIVEVRNNNEYVRDLHETLQEIGVESDGITSASASRVDDALETAGHKIYSGNRTLEEDIEYQERLARDDVMAAMQEGRRPDETDFPPEYFPQNYRDMHNLDAEIARLEADREEADGSSWAWWDSDDAELARIDADLKEKRQERDGLADGLGVSGGGRMTRIETISAMGSWTGDPTWEGEQYGHWTNEYYEENLVVDEHGNITLNNTGVQDNGDEFTRIGNEITGNPDAALAYYNKIGVEGASHLPTVLADSVGLDDGGENLDEVLDDYSIALGEASKLEGPGARSRLKFSGDELMAGPQVTANESRRSRRLVYSPAFLFVTGDFDQQFLVDATAESLRQAEEDPDRAASINAAGTYGSSSPYPGEDARNILLSRSSEDPDTSFAVVAELSSTNDVDLLLSPDTPYPLTYRDDRAYHPHPQLESDAPVTTFLIIAGSDDRTANTIMSSAAQDPEPFSDPSVAAGIDGIMAQHATLMYDLADLDAVGIEQTGINDLNPPAQDIDADAWRTVHGKVLDYGRGGLLMVATEDLVDLAIVGALDQGEGNFDIGLVDPFATMAGAVGAETAEGYFTYYEGLDDEARERNRRVNTGVSVGLSVLNLADPTKGIVSGGASAVYAYFDPFADPDDRELQAYREQYAQLQYVGQDRSAGWEEIIYHRCLDAAIEGGGATINTDDPDDLNPTRRVPVRKVQDDDGNTVYEWQVEGEKWEPVPAVDAQEHQERFGLGTPINIAVGQARYLDHRYMDGVLVSADDREELIRRRDASESSYNDLDGHETDQVEIDLEAATNPKTSEGRERVERAVEQAAEHDVEDWVADG